MDVKRNANSIPSVLCRALCGLVFGDLIDPVVAVVGVDNVTIDDDEVYVTIGDNSIVVGTHTYTSDSNSERYVSSSNGCFKISA